MTVSPMTASPATTALRIAMSTLLLLGCAACSQPEPPKKEQPPEPQAQSEQNTELRDTIQAPIDKAKGVESTVLDAAQQQEADIDAQTGG